MMPLDECIKIARVFNQHLQITYDLNGRYLVGIRYCDVKDSKDDAVLSGFCGRSDDFQCACQDMLNNVKGKLLVYHPPENEGSRKEVICI